MEESLLPRTEETAITNIKGKFCEESKKIWAVSFPAIIAQITSFGIFVVTQAFIGHISELDLAAYALTQTLTLRFTNGILMGMSSATETLCGQAFGAKQHHMLGIYLQRSWFINFITATIMLPVFIFTEQIFRLLHQDDDICIKAGKISLWFIPALYSFVFRFTTQQFLQAQLRNRIVGWLSAGTLIFHVLISWLFVMKLNWGLYGAMGAMNISQWVLVLGQFVYVFGGWCSNTWKGFTTSVFADLGPILKLSISSGVMLCLELWYNSVLVLVAGYMANAVVAISAFSICLNISAWEFMIALGFLVGASVRVSNELGRGNAKAAKYSVQVIMCTSSVVGVFFFVLCLIFGDKIGYLFSSEEEIVQAVSSLSVLLAFTILLNSVQPVLSGVAVGSGRQGMVAFVNIGSYYVIGVPIGILLAYVAGMEVQGLWIGMICGVVMQTSVLGYITWKTDWDGQVRKASERLNMFLKPSDEPDQHCNQEIE